MLTRFTVGNFCSFDKNQTLSLISGSIQNKKERLFKTKDFKLLKFASIFGANASGKSNFIKAMEYAQAAVMVGMEHPLFEVKKYSYNRLSPKNKDKTSYFEFEICIDDEIYAYGFEILIFQKRVCEEWLIKLDKNNKDIPIFTRNIDNKQIYFNPEYLTEKNAERMKVYMDDFKSVSKKLFLSEIVSNKEELYRSNPKLIILRKLIAWIARLNISYPDTSISGYDCFSQKNIDELFNALSSFKTGISKIIPCEISKEQALDKLNSEFRKEIEESIIRACPPECDKNEKDCDQCGFRMNCNGRLIFVTFRDRTPVFTEITFEHFNVPGVYFSLAEESDGTQRLLDLLSVLFIQKENSVFVIDEIDRSLHPQLTMQFIKSFLKLAENKNIQLIITTHESHLLNLKLLRQDEIFFVEAGHSGESILYSFDKFKERFDKKIEDAYLDGRYGAVPLFDSIYTPFDSESKE